MKTTTTSASVIAMATSSSSSKKYKFAVGDLITGLPNNGSIISNENALMRVVEINEEDGTFNATLVAHRQKKAAGMEATFNNLNFDKFTLASDELVNELMGSATKKKASKPEAVYKFDGNLTIKKYEDEIESDFNSMRRMVTEGSPDRVEALNDICEGVKAAKAANKKFNLREHMKKNPEKFKCFNDMFGDEALEKAIQDLLNFFTEFQFVPNYRFVNTLGLKAASNFNAAKEYITNYFKLTNNPFADAIKDKLSSPEFNTILNTFSLNKPDHMINSRLKVYFGAAGSGKTTQAMTETEGRCVVCNNSILPQDLLEDFTFNDGKAGFIHSAFCKAIENGQSILLDEINLLPFETVRFLQGLLDGKPSFVFKGETIKINPNFTVIGTMNLCVNGSVFGLPEPLVDRCSSIDEFELNAKQLLGAF